MGFVLVWLGQVRNTMRNNDAYHTNRYRASSGEVEDFRYYAEGNWLSQKFTRFIVEDSQGNKTVIYDVTEEINSRNIVFCVLISSITSLFIFAIYKKKTENDNQQ